MMASKLRQFRCGLCCIFLWIFSQPGLAQQNCSDEELVRLVTKAKQELRERLYLTLATAERSGVPWNTPVYTAFDAQYTFFWISARLSQHSRNISQNNQVFVVVYDSTVAEGKGFAVYMQGQAHELNDAETIAYGLQWLSQRAGVPLPPPPEFQGLSPQRIYKFLPQKTWVNTVVLSDGKYVDKRIDVTECMSTSINLF